MSIEALFREWYRDYQPVLRGLWDAKLGATIAHTGGGCMGIEWDDGNGTTVLISNIGDTVWGGNVTNFVSGEFLGSFWLRQPSTEPDLGLLVQEVLEIMPAVRAAVADPVGAPHPHGPDREWEVRL